MDPRDIPPEIVARFPKGKIEVVYAYVLIAEGDRFIALARDVAWTLPGGIVEGGGTPVIGTGTFRADLIGEPPEGFDDMAHAHAPALAWYVKEQTGLDLDALSAPFGVKVFVGEGGRPAASVLYSGTTSGERLGGELVDPRSIWEFDGRVPLDVARLQEFFGIVGDSVVRRGGLLRWLRRRFG